MRVRIKESESRLPVWSTRGEIASVPPQILFFLCVWLSPRHGGRRLVGSALEGSYASGYNISVESRSAFPRNRDERCTCIYPFCNSSTSKTIEQRERGQKKGRKKRGGVQQPRTGLKTLLCLASFPRCPSVKPAQPGVSA
jgi:hypothetical protein